MSQPVWVLSVDLQTKTATFQTGLADAARSARGSFTDIKSGANEMGSGVNYSMGEARHSVMLLGEEFGVHLPRALSTFIAGLGPIGPALEAAFPFLAIAVGATLLIEHLVKMHEAGEKLTDDQVKFGTAANNAFNALDQKLIQAQIKADELKNNHLGALALQLELIDKQSMGELQHSFEELAKAADVVMKDLEGHWYTFGVGSEGANHALQQFGTQYESLLSQGKDDAATGLLSGTLKQAQKVLEFQKQYRDNSGTLLSAPKEGADSSTAMIAANELKRAGAGYDDKAIAAQEQLVEALQKQQGIEERIAAIKKKDSSNAKGQAGNEESARQAAAARQSAESMARMGEQSVASDKAIAEAGLSVHRATLEQRLSVELEFAGRERDVQLAANQAEIAGLDKSGKDYSNQLKALKDKALEIDNEYAAKTSEMQAKSSVEVYDRDLRAMEAGERGKIEATQEGSAARLAVINNALKQEQAANLEDTNFFRELLNMRVETARKEAEEEGKLREEAGKEAASAEEKSGELTLSAEKQNQAVLDSSRRMSESQRVAEAQKFATEEYAIKLKALEQDEAALDKTGKDYNNKLKQLQDQEKQLTQEHVNEIADIKEKAEIASNQRILAAETQSRDAIASGLTQSIMGHQTWARMVTSFGDQAVEGMIKNSLLIMMQQDKERLSDARSAAASAYSTGEKIGGPAGIILGPVFAAAAFANVMAFEGGTDRVPGVGVGDIVPSMLSPGEGVVPGGVMDGLRGIARNGGFDQGPRYTIHAPIHMSASVMDADGVDKVFTQHSDTIQKHFENTIRKLNR